LRFLRRREERAQLLVEIAQRRIMEEECVINLREPLHEGIVRRQLITTFYEGTDDIDTHLDRLSAVQNICRHQRPKLGEGVGRIATSPAFS
jgi:hypothetical protein